MVWRHKNGEMLAARYYNYRAAHGYAEKVGSMKITKKVPLMYAAKDRTIDMVDASEFRRTGIASVEAEPVDLVPDETLSAFLRRMGYEIISCHSEGHPVNGVKINEQGKFYMTVRGQMEEFGTDHPQGDWYNILYDLRRGDGYTPSDLITMYCKEKDVVAVREWSRRWAVSTERHPHKQILDFIK